MDGNCFQQRCVSGSESAYFHFFMSLQPSCRSRRRRVVALGCARKKAPRREIVNMVAAPSSRSSLGRNIKGRIHLSGNHSACREPVRRRQWLSRRREGLWRARAVVADVQSRRARRCFLAQRRVKRDGAHCTTWTGPPPAWQEVIDRISTGTFN